MIKKLVKNRDQIKQVSLGDKIIKSNIFQINIPNAGFLYGIRHLPIIQKVKYLFYNFRQEFQINAELDQELQVWKVSEYLIPLSKLLEYSDDLKLEVEITINNNRRNQFYTFHAIFDKGLSPEDIQQIDNLMYLSIPTIKEGVSIEYLGNIWRLVSI